MTKRGRTIIALPLSAGELVGVARHEHARRAELHHLEGLFHAAPALGRIHALGAQRLHDRHLDRVARVERVVRILKDDLQVLTHGS